MILYIYILSTYLYVGTLLLLFPINKINSRYSKQKRVSYILEIILIGKNEYPLHCKLVSAQGGRTLPSTLYFILNGIDVI